MIYHNPGTAISTIEAAIFDNSSEKKRVFDR
jgi:hypothetical protein